MLFLEEVSLVILGTLGRYRGGDGLPLTVGEPLAIGLAGVGHNV